MTLVLNDMCLILACRYLLEDIFLHKMHDCATYEPPYSTLSTVLQHDIHSTIFFNTIVYHEGLSNLELYVRACTYAYTRTLLA